jgi:HEAT repeat protein
MSAKELFQEIIDLDEKINSLREQFESCPLDDQLTVLSDVFRDGIAKLKEEDPLSMSLVRVTEMLCHIPSDSTAKIVGEGLDHSNPGVRLLSGDALLHMTDEGLGKIMPAIEDALAKGGIRAQEMPFMLTDVDDPEVTRVLERFLKVPEPEVVASAIEALAEFGDPSALPALEELTKDDRKIEVEEGGPEEGNWTIGQLALDAIEIISEES